MLEARPAGWPVVVDPLFYAVAILAVLITGLSKSGFAAGFGSLATPLIALTMPAPQAAAIMLPVPVPVPVLVVMDVTGLQQMWRDRDPHLLRQLLLWGVLGVGVGSLLFGLLSDKAVAGLLGVLTLGFLDLRNLFTSLLLVPLAPLGVWAGVWLVRRVDPTWFYRLAYAGMFLTGVKLLWDGVK